MFSVTTLLEKMPTKKEDWTPTTLEVGCAPALRDYNQTAEADGEADAFAEREEQVAAQRAKCWAKREW